MTLNNCWLLTDFEQLEKLVVILLNLMMSKNLVVILLTLNELDMAASQIFY